MNRDELRRYLDFYRDLGFTELWKHDAPAPVAAPEPIAIPKAPVAPRVAVPPPPPPPAVTPPPAVAPPPVAMPPESKPVMQNIALPSLAPDNDTMELIRTDIGDCKRCRLCQGRNKIVFGSGNESSRLVFVGEGPGADEDAQGLPFVGKAGQLLTQMIDNTCSKEGIPARRVDMYICNVVKCRPPENRTPQPDEMETCGQFLFRQLMVIQPKAICCLGSTATKALLGTTEGVMKLRGKWHKWRDTPVMVTYHPSYLLRPYNQNAKREAWEDLKKVFHFVYD
ncbi:MAG: uracil-DNA glycosylase [Bryobacteraceae bacterium]